MNFEQFFTPNHVVGSLPGQVVAVLAPHPDDEVFGCGGTLCGLSNRGAEVHVAIVSESTKHGSENDSYAAIRREESLKAASILNYPGPEFWGMPDGSLMELGDLEAHVCTWLAELNPDLVIAPSIWEMHRDHRAVAIAALNSMEKLPDQSQLAMYEVGIPLTPNRLIDITAHAEKKEAAMNCFRSQLAQQDYADQIRGLNRFRSYSLSMDIRYAEAFLLLSRKEAVELVKEKASERINYVLREAERKITLSENMLLEAHAENVSLKQMLDSAYEQSIQQQELARQQYQQLQEQLELSNGQSKELRKELKKSLDDVAGLENNVKEIFASTSWRLTGPLRLVTRVIRGEQSLRSATQTITRNTWHRLPGSPSLKGKVRSIPANLRRKYQHYSDSECNREVAQKLLEHRISLVNRPFAPNKDTDTPEVDISVLTYNSAGFLGNFINSLISQNYALNQINLVFVDNDSTDGTLLEINRIQKEYSDRFLSIQVLSRPNKGFGAGNNAGISVGTSDYILVVNPDVEFEPDSLVKLVTAAVQDDSAVACWEARQKPYEHPKLYDPVTLETNWCSHACVLLRRTAMEEIGGYDERIFLYSEDVELSYRLREADFILKYVPSAVVWHFTYDSAGQVKPEQYIGSIVGNVFLRTRYGSLKDMLFIFPLLFTLFMRSPFKGSRRALSKRLMNQYFKYLPQLLRERKARKACIATFRLLDYDQVREGAFWEGQSVLENGKDKLPLVSIITRTVAGRSSLLKQAGYTVFNQTYPNIEWVVVEDGGQEQKDVVDEFMEAADMKVHYEPLSKVGRSAAGNKGMEIADGQWLMFLDDDDCLYADHVETLMLALLDHESAVAAYSLAWEVESRIDDGGRSIVEAAYYQVPGLRQPFDYECLKQRNYIPIQSIIFNAKLYKERGGFDVSLDYLEDWHLWQRYAYQNQFIYVPKTTSMHRTPMDAEERGRRQRLLDEAYLEVKERANEAVENIGNNT